MNASHNGYQDVETAEKDAAELLERENLIYLEIVEVTCSTNGDSTERDTFAIMISCDDGSQKFLERKMAVRPTPYHEQHASLVETINRAGGSPLKVQQITRYRWAFRLIRTVIRKKRWVNCPLFDRDAIAVLATDNGQYANEMLDGVTSNIDDAYRFSPTRPPLLLKSASLKLCISHIKTFKQE
jgi:hypothetical protein